MKSNSFFNGDDEEPSLCFQQALRGTGLPSIPSTYEKGCGHLNTIQRGRPPMVHDYPGFSSEADQLKRRLHYNKSLANLGCSISTEGKG